MVPKEERQIAMNGGVAGDVTPEQIRVRQRGIKYELPATGLAEQDAAGRVGAVGSLDQRD